MCKKVGTCFQFWIVAGVQTTIFERCFVMRHASCQRPRASTQSITRKNSSTFNRENKVMVHIIGPSPCFGTHRWWKLRANITSEDKGNSTIGRHRYVPACKLCKIDPRRSYPCTSCRPGWMEKKKERDRKVKLAKRIFFPPPSESRAVNDYPVLESALDPIFPNLRFSELRT